MGDGREGIGDEPDERGDEGGGGDDGAVDEAVEGKGADVMCVLKMEKITRQSYNDSSADKLRQAQGHEGRTWDGHGVDGVDSMNSADSVKG